MIDSSRDLDANEKARDRSDAKPAPPPATIVGLGVPETPVAGAPVAGAPVAEAPVAATSAYVESAPSHPAIAKHTLVGFPGPPPLEEPEASAPGDVPQLTDATEDEVTVVGGYNDVTTVTPWDVGAVARVLAERAPTMPAPPHAAALLGAWPEAAEPPPDTAPEASPGPLAESPTPAGVAAVEDEPESRPPSSQEPVLPLSAIIAEATPQFDAPTLQTPLLDLLPAGEANAKIEGEAPPDLIEAAGDEAPPDLIGPTAGEAPPDLIEAADDEATVLRVGPRTATPEPARAEESAPQPFSSRGLSKPPPPPRPNESRPSQRVTRHETLPPPSSDRELFVSRDTELQLFAPPVEMFGPGSPRPRDRSETLEPFTSNATLLQSDAPWTAEAEDSVPRKSRGGRVALLTLIAAGFGALAVFSGVFAPKTGRVLVTVSGPLDAPVSGAAVLVDGKHGCAPAPCRITLDEGAYVLGASAPAHRRAAEKALSVARGSEEAIHFTLLPTDSSGLEIKSSVPGLRVAVDGLDRGTTPITLRGLAAGKHRIRLSGNAEYAPFETELSLEADRVAVFEPKLTPLPEVVAAEALDPNGADDIKLIPTPTGPAPKPAPKADAALLAKLRGNSAPPVPAAKVDLDTPEPPPAIAMSKLSITSNPPSNVVVDGRPLGSTPRELEVSPGEHSVVFIHPTKGRKSVRVRAQGGKAAVASVKF